MKLPTLPQFIVGILLCLAAALAPLMALVADAESPSLDCVRVDAPVEVPTASLVPPAETPMTTNCATDRSGLILRPTVLVDGEFSTVQLRVEGTSLTAIHIDQVKIRPPAFAVVDGTTPSVSRNDNGATWFPDTLVVPDLPLVGYEVREWGPADVAVVEVRWSTTNDKGTLQVTISGVPTKPLKP